MSTRQILVSNDQINVMKERIPHDTLAGIQSTASALSAAAVLAKLAMVAKLA